MPSARPLVLALGLTSLSTLAQPADAPTRQAPLAQEDEEKLLYAIGVSIGRDLAPFALTPEELKVVARGLQEAATARAEDVDPQLTRLKEFEFHRRARRLAQEKEKGRLYLAQAAKEKGAQALPSGLVYQSLSEGVGPSPSAVDAVRVHYRGKLLDGREFDSSYRLGQPAQFSLRNVIPCWTEGLQKMKTNGRARLVCPSGIAYGDKGNPPTIPPGATLVFEVELLEVLPRGETRIQ